MNIGFSIVTLRRERGISQETLAESVGVSRQAVTKWESGESLPELENLVAIAHFFGVTVDSLLRPAPCGNDDAAPGAANPADSSALLASHSFLEFLCRAKRATYADKGAETGSSRAASHDLAYSEADFSYYDTYLGGELFSGEEAVWTRGMPAWAMNYSGRVLEADLFPPDFLKESLSAVTPEMPWRGPRVFERGDFAYHCMVSGGMDWFQGTEEILVRGIRTYECVFHGGAVR